MVTIMSEHILSHLYKRLWGGWQSIGGVVMAEHYPHLS